MTKILSAWILRVPTGKPEDQLYNRRLLSYYSLAFSAIWVHEVLIVIVVGMVFGHPMDGAVAAALVGVPAALSGLGFWKYLEACKESDKAQITATQEAQNGTTEPVNIPTPAPAEVGPTGSEPAPPKPD